MLSVLGCRFCLVTFVLNVLNNVSDIAIGNCEKGHLAL